MGLMWFLSSFGVYLRDIGQVTSVIVGGLMFISPIFYPLQAVPEQYRWLIQINPLTYFIELGRDLLLWGQMPNWQNWFLAVAISMVVFVIGFVTFQKLRRGFADVL
jgi:lipopolysaccharide transport system permease protein